MYKMEILLVTLFRLAMDEDGEETVNEMLTVSAEALVVSQQSEVVKVHMTNLSYLAQEMLNNYLYVILLLCLCYH